MKPCPHCGTEFDGPRIYCKAACYYAHRIGDNHPNWKGGGRRASAEGYVRTLIYPDDPHYAMGRRHSPISRDVLEHRLVMAQSIGRDLLPTETVHHLNGDRKDNRLENLELRVGRHGKGSTHAHCATCTCFD